MGENSKIEWTDHTFNPWMGCTKVSPGCANCYAEDLMMHRYKKATWGKGASRTKTREANWKEPLKWNRQALAEGVRHRVFCASLADVFDQEVPDEWRHQLFEIIKITPGLDWLILTKRAKEMRDYMAEERFRNHKTGLPLSNVWLGVSVEDQDRADERIPYLLQAPAAVRFLSVEPMLEAIDIGVALNGTDYSSMPPRIPVDWVICGGESGKTPRPMGMDWVLDLHRQCKIAGTAFFMKQDNGPFPGNRGRIPDDIWATKQFPRNPLMRDHSKPLKLELVEEVRNG